MKLANKNMRVEIDKSTGYTTCIQSETDPFKMNWILSHSDFGKVDGFTFQKCITEEGCAFIFAENAPCKISLVIKKQIGEAGYSESYTFHNNSDIEWFVNKDAFGIHFPFACHTAGIADFQEKTCNAHLWCGEDICWIYCSKLSGDPLHLIANMTEGSISDYTISRDRAREPKATNYRGDFVLNPAPKTVLPGESVTYTFRFAFAAGDPFETLREYDGFIHLDADKYTVTPGEPIAFSAYCKDGLKDFRIVHNGECIPAEIDGAAARWTMPFDEIGEKTFFVHVNGKKTHITVNVIEPPEIILKKRASFIASKQQYHQSGSPLDGAYLCYDRDTDSLHYSSTWHDHNASRERIAMGITLLKQLQNAFDAELFASVTKHRQFVERELFDKETCMVYNDVGRNNDWLRIYNFPWFSVYFFEWYQLTKQPQFLEYAAKIILKYYELGGNEQESQDIEACRIIAELKQQNLMQLAKAVEDAFLIHVENIYNRNFRAKSEEVGWVSETPSVKATYLLQGYLLTKNQKYLEKAEVFISAVKSFYGLQPDYHLNTVCVRHWDRYWFGRHKEYGDVFPHYWSALSAESFYWYQKATGIDCSKEIHAIIGANLCLYQPDGFAANNYLYPYKVNVFSSTDEDIEFAGLGTFYGKHYDERANDQDWVLYFATVLK